jgi:hypothetical protein
VGDVGLATEGLGAHLAPNSRVRRFRSVGRVGRVGKFSREKARAA